MKLCLSAAVAIVFYTLLLPNSFGFDTHALSSNSRSSNSAAKKLIIVNPVLENFVTTTLTKSDSDSIIIATGAKYSGNRQQQLAAVTPQNFSRFKTPTACSTTLSLPAFAVSIVILIWTIVCLFSHNAFYVLLEKFPFPPFFGH